MQSKAMQKLFTKFLLPLAAFIILLIFFKGYIAAIFAAAYIAYLLYSSRSSIYAIMGNISYSKGDMDKSIQWLKKSCSSGKARPRVIISYAYLLLKQGNVQESGTILRKLLNSNPGFDDEMLVKANLALVLWKEDRLDEAVELLEEVIEKYKNSTVYGSLGYLLLLKGDLDRALELNLEAYNYNDSNTIILDNLGQAYFLKNEPDKAEEIFVKLMSANPSYPEAYYNYGLLLDRKGEHRKALEFMEKALTFKFTFLSTITQDEVEAKINEIKTKV